MRLLLIGVRQSAEATVAKGEQQVRQILLMSVDPELLRLNFKAMKKSGWFLPREFDVSNSIEFDF